MMAVCAALGESDHVVCAVLCSTSILHLTKQ
jgi:hypothetical protein